MADKEHGGAAEAEDHFEDWATEDKVDAEETAVLGHEEEAGATASETDCCVTYHSGH